MPPLPAEPATSPRLELASASPGAVAAYTALLGVGAFVAVRLTRGHTALPLPLWFAGVVALALVTAIVWRSGAPSVWDSALAALVGVAASASHLLPGVLLGHDTVNHVWGAWAWLQAWQAGDLVPIWLHHLGLGLPLPLFYGPLPFYAMAPAALAGLGVDRMYASSFFLAGATGALLAHRAVAAWTRDRRAALVAATAFAYAPYRLLDANYRAALGETWALAFLPLVFYSFERLLVEARRRDFVRAAVAVALLAIAHPLSLLLPAALVPVLWLALRPPWSVGVRRSASAALRSVAAYGLGLALAGGFVLPLVAEIRAISLPPWAEPRAAYRSHGLHLDQLVARRLWDTSEGSQPEPASAPATPEMPFYFGVAFLGALAAAMLGFAAPRNGRTLAALGTLGFAALALSLHAVARVVAPGFPLLDTLRFPWRFLGPASAAAALALGLLVAGAARGRWVAPLSALAIVALLADGFPYSGAVARIAPWSGLAHANLWADGVVTPKTVARPWPIHVDGHLLPPRHGRDEVGIVEVYPEYFTHRARGSISDAVGLLASPTGALDRRETLPYARSRRGSRVVARDFERGQGRITVFAGRRDHHIEVDEQYFPGWQVEVDGRWREVTPTKNGLLAVDRAGPAGPVRFRFDRWRGDRLAGWLLSAFTVVALLLMARRRPLESSVASA